MRYAAEHKRLDKLLAAVQPRHTLTLTDDEQAALDAWRAIVDAMSVITGPSETYRMIIEGDPALRYPLASPVDDDADAAGERYKDAIRRGR